MVAYDDRRSSFADPAAPGLHGTALVPWVKGFPAADGGHGEPAASPDVCPGGQARPMQPRDTSLHLLLTVPRTDITSNYFSNAES